MNKTVTAWILLFLGTFYLPVFADTPNTVPDSAPQEYRRLDQRRDNQAVLVEITFWNTVKSEDSAAMYGLYLTHYPTGHFAPLATSRIEQLNSQQGKTFSEEEDYRDFNFGRYHALIIGNNRYKHWPTLENAGRDAEALSGVLENRYGFAVTLLPNATRKDIITKLGEFRRTLGEGDNLLIYYAGHGYLDESVDRGYWIPVDADRDNTVNWVRNDTITDGVKALSAKHVLVISDSCYSGKLARGVTISLDNKRAFFESLTQKKARTVMTSGGLEPVLDGGGRQGLSVFATAFMDALAEAGKIVDATTLFTDIRRKVQLNADQTPEYSNIRKAGHEGGDFLFVRR